MEKYRTLELSLISAENLKQVNHLSRMKVYAVVSVSGHPKQPKRRTGTDRSGGCNPSWGSAFRFPVPVGDPWLAVHIELRTEHALGDRDVGEVAVPLRELPAVDDTKVAKRVSYQVRDSHSEESMGVINFSYRLSGESVMSGPTPVAVQPETTRRRDEDGEGHRFFWGRLILKALVSGIPPV